MKQVATRGHNFGLLLSESSISLFSEIRFNQQLISDVRRNRKSLVKTKYVSRFGLFAVMVAAIFVAFLVFTRQNQWKLSRAAWDGDIEAVKQCVWLGANIDATPVCDGGANSGEPAFILSAG